VWTDAGKAAGGVASGGVKNTPKKASGVSVGFQVGFHF